MKFYIASCVLLSLTKSARVQVSATDPSHRPSEMPSESPSLNPSESPSLNPSESPSETPSLNPSESPSETPSLNPSESPSLKPSESPSETPSLKPSESPSETPSLNPSESPSLKPSESPSDVPSLNPSESPSLKPSESPSETPSLKPSESPSDVPSLNPSETPSLKPSESPSLLPSSIPSEAPSSMPSSIPSEMPSSIPSEAPSSMPSSIPSEMPSSIPSEQPTSQPSEQPSAQPSCTPSMAPTNPDTMFLFYPDWTGSGEGCRNDGGEPAYMAANPSTYLSTSLVTCCNTYFGWIFDSCVGNLPGICSRALFYPDWEGANQGCIDDGNEPEYMRDNAMGLLFVHLAECCAQHYSWNSQVCLNAPATLNSNLYYPDWEGDDTCKNGGGQPNFMNDNPNLWMHTTLAACCSANYNYKLDECNGSGASSGGSLAGSSTSTSATSGLWYPVWGASGNDYCENDGNQPEYMNDDPSSYLYASQRECCRARFSWDFRACVAA